MTETTKSRKQQEQWMRRAIALAQRGEGRVEPNPMVGCVIVRKGKIIAEGFHRRFGEPHAEIEALRKCRGTARGATVYVSLEPCAHHGKTPPCAQALIDAEISRVVVAAGDPNPLVRGRGVRKLRSAGISVETGLLRDEALVVLAPYHTRMAHRRVYVIAKWAQSLDGKLATHTGNSKWISCAESRRVVHRLRARVDAILVGSGTALADDPQLTARDVTTKRVAMRVVLDRRLRIAERSRLTKQTDGFPTLFFTTTANMKTPKAKRLARCGVEIIPTPLHHGRLNLAACLDVLYQRDVTNLLVEGGPTVLTAFFREGLVDEAQVFVAPILIGGSSSPSPILDPMSERIEDALKPTGMSTRRCGTDLLYKLRFNKP